MGTQFEMWSDSDEEKSKNRNEKRTLQGQYIPEISFGVSSCKFLHWLHTYQCNVVEEKSTLGIGSKRHMFGIFTVAQNANSCTREMQVFVVW